VIIGSAHGPRDVLALDEHENVHFLGPRTYPDVLRYVQCFDVALIPHLDNEMTRAMNPLKAFMYAGCGVPVVSTGISSLDGLRDAIQFAASADEFIAAVNAVVDRPRSAPHPPPSETLVRDHSWQARVHEIERLLDGLQPEAPDDQLAIPA
jgi:glycosyltransferase involved in cell wall biosynthesis